MGSLRQDSRQAIRLFCEDRLVTMMVVACLGLSIGAATAIFSFAEAVVWRALPYRDPGGLVILWASKVTEVRRGISAPDLDDLRTLNHAFEDLVPVRGDSGEPLNLGGGDSRTVTGYFVGAGFFSVLGARPLLGRTFRPDEDTPGSEGAAVLSYSLWQVQFGGDHGVINRTIELSGEAYRVVGVMPPEFFFPNQTVRVWLTLPARLIPPQRGFPSVHALARLRPGVTLPGARVEVDRVVRILAAGYADTDKDLRIGLFPVADEIVGNYQEAFVLLFGAVALLLAIACANVAHLLLARGVRRTAEISVRVALGATRGAILRQLLTESAFLCAASGAAGLFVAALGVRALGHLGLTDIPRFMEAGIDQGSLLFALIVSLFAGLLFGLSPALRASWADPMKSLNQGGTPSATRAQSALGDLLVGSQIALAFALAAAAALLLNSFVRLTRVRWGFRPEHVLVLDVLDPRSEAMDIARNSAFAEQVLSGLRGLPGVTSAGVSRGSPLTAVQGGPGEVTAGGREELYPRVEVVGPGYFETLGIPIVRGRGFEEGDDARGAKVAVVEREVAEQLWPGNDPIGRNLYIPNLKPGPLETYLRAWNAGQRNEVGRLPRDANSWEMTPYVVVGEVGAVLMYGPLQHDTRAVYVDFRQRPNVYPMVVTSFLLRTSTDPTDLGKAASEVLRRMGGGRTVLHADTLEERVKGATGGRGPEKLLLVVSLATGGLAVLLAALGVYGVLAFTTALRTREVAIRLALGASRSDIFRMILGRGVMLALVGLLFGLGGTLVAAKTLSGYLFGIAPTDAPTLAGTSLVILSVALLACYDPARRATKVDPTMALRHE